MILTTEMDTESQQMLQVVAPTAITGPSEPVLEPMRLRKSTLSKVLPTDRLTLERQIAAIRAFAAVYEANGGKPVTNAEAGDVAKMAAGTIVATNAFFADIGLLARVEGGFTVAPEVNGFLLAEAGISPENAPGKLRPFFEKQWFMQLLTPRLRLGPMECTGVIKVLGEAATATPEHIPRLEMLVEFLCFVGCLVREGSQIRLANVLPKPAEEEIAKPVKPAAVADETDGYPGLEKYTLTLDPKSKRRIVIHAPPTVTSAELNRIQQWLSFQLIITDPQLIPA